MNAPLPTPNRATSPGSLTVLPEAWIEKIFLKFEARYGSLFHDRWKGCDLANVKATWAEELANFGNKPEAIGYALKVLASAKFPPTLPEFFEACRNAPEPYAPALPYVPTASDRERMKAMANKAALAVTGKSDEYDPLLWAKRPKSQKAMDAVIDGAKRSDKLAAILADLSQSGVCNEAGKLLKRYKGGGQWATV